MIIKILGSGCKNCKNLEANARKAAEELGIDAVIEKVTDFSAIAEYGVMRTPALVVDDAVKFFGKVLSAEEIKPYLK